MEITGTPTSITSTSKLAMNIATVPPPPPSTLPSSPVCHRIFLLSKVLRISAINSAEASDVPALPRAPVYFITPTPLFK